MESLPTELQVYIINFLDDDIDVFAVRSTCRALRNACFLLSRPLQWPKGQTDTTLMPWTPTRLYVTQHTPSEVVLNGDVSIEVTHARFLLSLFNVHTLTLSCIYEDLDLSAFINLKTLIINCNITCEAAVLLPPNVEHLELYEMTTPVSLYPCTKLKSVTFSNFVLFGWERLDLVEKCYLYRMNVPDAERMHLQTIPDLHLKACTMRSPDVLYTKVLKLVHSHWEVYPALPNVHELNICEYFMPVVRTEDLNRCNCVSVYIETGSMQVQPGFTLQSWAFLRELRLSFGFNTAPDALTVTSTPAGFYQIPDLPCLELLQLNGSNMLLPVHAPLMKTLILANITWPMVIAPYPELTTAWLNNINAKLTIHNIPKLKQLRISFTDCPISLLGLDSLHLLELHNVGATIKTKFAIPALPHLRRASFMELMLFNVERLANLKYLNFEQCRFPKQTNFAALANIPTLFFNACNDLSDASPFQKASVLSLCSTSVTNVSMLSAVRELWLEYCVIDAWHGLRSLHSLYIDFTNIVDLSPLAHHEHLTTLSLCNTMVADLRPLSTIPTLRSVMAVQCVKIVDANPLKHVHTIDMSACIELRQVMELNQCINLDFRGCVCLPAEHIDFLRSTVSFVHWHDEEDNT